MLPGVGTVVGGVIGSLGGGTAVGAAVKAITGLFIKDDAEQMCAIIEEEIQNTATDYLMNEEEVKRLVEFVNGKLDGKTLKDMFASKDRPGFVRALMEEEAKAIAKDRPAIGGNIDGEIVNGLVSVLKEAVEGGANGNQVPA